jgi:hypothetical protein
MLYKSVLQMLTVDNSCRPVLLFHLESHTFTVPEILKFPFLHG